MARDLFRLEKGIHVVGTNLDTGVQILFGSTVPGGETVTDNAEQGSVYHRTNGEYYQKDTAGTGADKWVRMVNQKDLNTFVWRSETVRAATGDAAPVSGSVIDLVANPFGDDDAPTLTASDFNVDEHIIFGVGGTPKLMRVSVVSAPNITVVDADTALAANNHFIVQNYLPDTPDDQEAQALVTYNGTDIVKIGDVNWDFATGINLSSGFSPANGSVSSADTVESAIEKLVANQDDFLSAVGVAKGDTDMGTTPGWLTDNTTQKALDLELEAEAQNVKDALGVSIGDDNMGAYTGDILTDNQTAKQNIQELSDAIEDVTTRTSALSVTTTTTLDSVPVDDVKACTWEVVAELVSNPAQKKYFTLSAVHDGTSSLDATATDDTEYARLKLGSTFNLTVATDVNGVGPAQVMRLRVGASAAVNVYATRTVVK